MPTRQNSAAGADAVRQHLVGRALHALHVHRRDAEDHEAHVADRRIRHQLLHVGLHHRDQRAVDDGDHRRAWPSSGAKYSAASGNSGKAKRIRP